MKFDVNIERVADVDAFRLVRWKVRRLPVLLNPADWTEDVSRVSMVQ